MRTGPVEKNMKSIKNLEHLLSEVCEMPMNFLADSDLLLAIKSQHGLAKYADAFREILPTSLNTQKRLSLKIFENGYTQIDSLRRQALGALDAAADIEKKVEKSARSVAGLSDKISELKRQVSLARQDCWHLSSAFTSALNLASNLAKNIKDPGILANWRKSRQEILAMVTLSSEGNYFMQEPLSKGDPNE